MKIIIIMLFMFIMHSLCITKVLYEHYVDNVKPYVDCIYYQVYVYYVPIEY